MDLRVFLVLHCWPRPCLPEKIYHERHEVEDRTEELFFRSFLLLIVLLILIPTAQSPVKQRGAARSDCYGNSMAQLRLRVTMKFLVVELYADATWDA